MVKGQEEQDAIVSHERDEPNMSRYYISASEGSNCPTVGLAVVTWTA